MQVEQSSSGSLKGSNMLFSGPQTDKESFTRLNFLLNKEIIDMYI